MGECKLGYKKIKGKYSKREFILPASGENGEFLKETEIKYPMIKIFLDIKDFITDEKIELFLRKCEEKALRELIKEKQIEEQNLKVFLIECPQELVEKCECKYYNRKYKKEFPQNYNFWEKEFLRCIKCMACVENCPLCFCEKCTLLDEFYIERGEIPPKYPVFHWIKILHMTGRCIECNLCYELCPGLIPLNYLTKKMNDFVKKNFGYEPGGKEINPLFKIP